MFVLTDRPWDYDADMRQLGLTPSYAPSAHLLLEELLEHPASGFVLEVDKVMHSPGPERDQLFQLACVFPLLRVLRKGQDRAVAYLDDPDGFSSRVRAFPAREVRHCGRVPVLLHGLLTSSEDESFASPVRANILDLSGVGGFVSCPGDFDFGQQVQLRIEGMEDSTPVLASIRWRKGEARKRLLHGFGLHFENIRPGQLRELAARFIGPLEAGYAGAGAA
ncbi:MAG: hypothetical protein A2051_05980 [Desulfovibrionales bacterium GWA2_65_9]|nr:MAG: hypothetical protein A2051_05980 [Desulfovibrionales bacterium GWA2_65_9]